MRPIVYVLLYETYDDWKIIGIYRDRELAENAIQALVNHGQHTYGADHFSIEEHTLV